MSSHTILALLLLCVVCASGQYFQVNTYNDSKCATQALLMSQDIYSSGQCSSVNGGDAVVSGRNSYSYIATYSASSVSWKMYSAVGCAGTSTTTTYPVNGCAFGYGGFYYNFVGLVSASASVAQYKIYNGSNCVATTPYFGPFYGSGCQGSSGPTSYQYNVNKTGAGVTVCVWFTDTYTCQGAYTSCTYFSTGVCSSTPGAQGFMTLYPSVYIPSGSFAAKLIPSISLVALLFFVRSLF